MLQISARDVVGTAHVNATLATQRLHKLYNGEYDNSIIGKTDILGDIASGLSRALTDVIFAQQMLESNFQPAVYRNVWE